MKIACDVLGLGAVAWDELLYVEVFPAPDTKVRVRARMHQCGGITGLALIAAARFGAHCAYAGRLGLDAASQQVAQALAAEGIDLTHAVRAENHCVVQSTIVVAENAGTRNVFSLSPGGTGADETAPVEAVLAGARVLLVDHHGLPGMIRAARLVRAAGGAVVADLERDDHPRFHELLALADHLILSEAFARRLTGAASPAAAAERLWDTNRAAVVVTAGAAGCWFRSRENSAPAHHPAVAVEAIDTTGCGDVFHGVYAAALAAGCPLLERLRLASAAAALKATRHAGPSAIPRRVEFVT